MVDLEVELEGLAALQVPLPRSHHPIPPSRSLALRSLPPLSRSLPLAHQTRRLLRSLPTHQKQRPDLPSRQGRLEVEEMVAGMAVYMSLAARSAVAVLVAREEATGVKAEARNRLSLCRRARFLQQSALPLSPTRGVPVAEAAETAPGATVDWVDSQVGAKPLVAGQGALLAVAARAVGTQAVGQEVARWEAVRAAPLDLPQGGQVGEEGPVAVAEKGEMGGWRVE